MFYLSAFLIFVYFKVARVHKKEEKMSSLILIQHIVVVLATLASYVYGFINLPWYFVLFLSAVYFIVAALMVTTVQLGIFIDGKPQFGMSKVYKYLPLLTLGIVLLSVMMWI